MKKVLELLVLFGDHNLLYFVLPILVKWYGVIVPYHHLFCCNVLAHDLLGGSIYQSDPDSQTARPQVRNTASGCNAAQPHGRNTGSADENNFQTAFILTNVSLSLAIFFSWVLKGSYKLQIIVKFTWIFLIKCCIRIVI